MNIKIFPKKSRITSNFRYLYDNHKIFLESYIKNNFLGGVPDSIVINRNSIICINNNDIISNCDYDTAHLTLSNICNAFHKNIECIDNPIHVFKNSISHITYDKQLLKYSLLIRDKFIKKNTWSKKTIITKQISYDCDRITVFYKYQDSNITYLRYFYQKDFNDITVYMNNEIVSNIDININTLVLHNDLEYNSINTLQNNKLKVIQYIKEGFSPLLSMDINKYYIVEECIEDGFNKYKLLNYNNMQRNGNGFIKVNKITSGVDRFIEHDIIGWIEKNDFNTNDVLLCPVIDLGYNTKIVVDPLSGSLSNIENKIILSKCLTTQLYIHNLKDKVAFNKLCNNSNMLHNVILQSNGRIERKTDNIINVSYYGSNKCCEIPLIINIEELDLEQKILNTHPTIIRHVVDTSIGINDNYLLIK